MLTTSASSRGYFAWVTSQRSEPERGDPSEAALLAEEAERRGDDAEVSERVQVERAATAWCELLAGTAGSPVEVVTGDGVRHRGSVSQVGEGWFLLTVGGRAVLIPLGHVLTVAGLRGPAPRSVARPGMGWVLRRWSQMRCDVTAHLLDGSSRSGHVVDVLADALILTQDAGPTESLTIPTAAVRWVVGDSFSDER